MQNVNLGLSEVANIVLSLLLIFQWYRDRAREDAVKNGLLAVREMVSRTVAANSLDILDALDANLATLGGRPPFVERCKKKLSSISLKFKASDMAPLPEASPIQKEDLQKVVLN